MWVRTTVTIERWTKERPGHEISVWDDSKSRGDFKETDRCCWKHKRCSGHIVHPLIPDYGHHKLHLHTVSHCDCDSRAKECSEKANSSSSRDVGQTCSRDMSPTCFKIIQTPCFELIPEEEECVERFWYGWCKSYRPVSVAVIHHPIHREFVEDDLNEDEEEEASKPPIPTQVGPTTKPPDTSTGTVTGTATGTPDSAAPITIWRSESPTGKSQGNKVIKKVKKKKEKEKDEEESDKEKAKLKKKIKKGKVTKKKSPVKSEPSPADLGRSISPRELARMSESSPDSREDLESEGSYNDPRQEEPSSEDPVESPSPRKREKNTNQNKKSGGRSHKSGR
ncbi:protein PROCA1 isoform X2 [Elephas maximus indicus]|uniref:protein PROCA1 isoform X2 n=1 Tax=Elephas maximus indicus TaxID=99487 RepID=UPI002115ED43|nr:protein PROCA1 isoform X2 [Elephas maximus indicus]